MPDTPDHSFQYGDDPAVEDLRRAYKECHTELGFYFAQTRKAHDDRRALWPGKSADMRKHGPKSFPWDGASDLECMLIQEKISTYVALLMGSLKRANIRAFPAAADDIGRARVMSAFFKWMRSNYIRDFYAQAERAANYWLEKGLMITHVGWDYDQRQFEETVTLQAIAEGNPDFAEAVLDPAAEADVVTALQSIFPAMKRGRARRVAKSLRTTGEAVIPYTQRTINRPRVDTCAPDGDVFYPSWCIDPQRSPYVFWRTFMTVQEVEQAVVTKGWDRDWADYVIEYGRGVDTSDLERFGNGSNANPLGDHYAKQTDLIEVCFGYRRLIDEDDGAEGIYCTVFSPKGGSQAQGIPDHAKHELQSGESEYPFEVTRLTEDQKRIYDLQNFADIFRGTQNQVKNERDARTDRSSMATLPPIWHRAGRRPKDYGPGRFLPVAREGELGFAPTPPFDPGSMEIEQTLIKQSDAVIGLDPTDPDGPVKKQFYIDKFLDHWARVLLRCFRQHKRHGDPRLVFRVTGYAEAQTMEVDPMEGDPDLIVTYDVLNNDPKTIENQLKQFMTLAQMDRFGKLDQESLIEVAANAINPVLADAFIMSKEESTQQILEDVTDRLTKAYAGIDTGAGQGGAQIALQAIQKYVEQEDIAERLQSDESFAGRIENIFKQYQFQIQQAENAQIGKIGGTPATFQGVQ